MRSRGRTGPTAKRASVRFWRAGEPGGERCSGATADRHPARGSSRSDSPASSGQAAGRTRRAPGRGPVPGLPQWRSLGGRERGRSRSLFTWARTASARSGSRRAPPLRGIGALMRGSLGRELHRGQPASASITRWSTWTLNRTGILGPWLPLRSSLSQGYQEAARALCPAVWPGIWTSRCSRRT